MDDGHDHPHDHNQDSRTLSVTSDDGRTEVMFPFGPGVLKTQLSPDLLHRLRRLASAARASASSDHRTKLAGNFASGGSHRLDIAPDDLDHLSRELGVAMTNYLSVAETFGRGTIATFESGSSGEHLDLGEVWVNFQRAGDFNPAHGHSGVFSFVTYLDVPEAIFTEQPPARSTVAGALMFHYGEYMELSANSLVIRPRSGELYLFPARLNHYVWPFFADVERVSVSGNLYRRS